MWTSLLCGGTLFVLGLYGQTDSGYGRSDAVSRIPTPHLYVGDDDSPRQRYAAAIYVDFGSQGNDGSGTMIYNDGGVKEAVNFQLYHEEFGVTLLKSKVKGLDRDSVGDVYKLGHLSPIAEKLPSKIFLGETPMGYGNYAVCVYYETDGSGRWELAFEGRRAVHDYSPLSTQPKDLLYIGDDGNGARYAGIVRIADDQTGEGQIIIRICDSAGACTYQFKKFTLEYLDTIKLTQKEVPEFQGEVVEGESYKVAYVGPVAASSELPARLFVSAKAYWTNDYHCAFWYRGATVTSPGIWEYGFGGRRASIK